MKWRSANSLKVCGRTGHPGYSVSQSEGEPYKSGSYIHITWLLIVVLMFLHRPGCQGAKHEHGDRYFDHLCDHRCSFCFTGNHFANGESIFLYQFLSILRVRPLTTSRTNPWSALRLRRCTLMILILYYIHARIYDLLLIVPWVCNNDTTIRPLGVDTNSN